MNPFTYSYPTKAYFGEKAAANNLATELAKVGPNVLLAYGGGSVIDCCKIVSAQAKLDKDIWELEYTDHKQPAEFIPMGAVVTAFGTGAEMNIPDDTAYKAIADSTVLTGGCAKKFTRKELLEVLLECR